jgi:hypothetical protein
MTSSGTQPLNIKSGISQQTLIGSSQILNLSLYDHWSLTKLYFVNPLYEDNLHWKTTILKLKYPSNCSLDHSYISNLFDQTMFFESFKWRRPPLEYNFKILKLEYISNRFLDHTQILNLDLEDQSKTFKYFKWRWPPIKDNLQLSKVKYPSNHLLNPS